MYSQISTAESWIMETLRFSLCWWETGCCLSLLTWTPMNGDITMHLWDEHSSMNTDWNGENRTYCKCWPLQKGRTEEKQEVQEVAGQLNDTSGTTDGDLRQWRNRKMFVLHWSGLLTGPNRNTYCSHMSDSHTHTHTQIKIHTRPHKYTHSQRMTEADFKIRSILCSSSPWLRNPEVWNFRRSPSWCGASTPWETGFKRIRQTRATNLWRYKVVLPVKVCSLSLLSFLCPLRL